MESATLISYQIRATVTPTSSAPLVSIVQKEPMHLFLAILVHTVLQHNYHQSQLSATKATIVIILLVLQPTLMVSKAVPQHILA